MPTRSARFRFDRRQLIFLVLSLVALYVIVPQIGSFRKSLPLLGRADVSDLWAALGCAVITYFAAAGTYYQLALRSLRYFRTVVIEVAGMFVNRLLPAGIGSIGVNYTYLRKNRHTTAQAATVVAANNALGIVGHVILLLVLLAAFHQQLPDLQLSRVWNAQVIIPVTILVLIIWRLLYRRFGRQLARGLHDFIRQLLTYRRRPGRLLAALACSASLTLANVLAFWLCLSAVGGNLSFVAVFLVFTFGIALGTATPTPGGLGGVEAGLVAGLVVYHVNSSTALAAVLVYRLLTYWLPLVAGGIAFIYSQKQRYI